MGTMCAQTRARSLRAICLYLCFVMVMVVVVEPPRCGQRQLTVVARKQIGTTGKSSEEFDKASFQQWDDLRHR